MFTASDAEPTFSHASPGLDHSFGFGFLPPRTKPRDAERSSDPRVWHASSDSTMRAVVEYVVQGFPQKTEVRHRERERGGVRCNVA